MLVADYCIYDYVIYYHKIGELCDNNEIFGNEREFLHRYKQLLNDGYQVLGLKRSYVENIF